MGTEYGGDGVSVGRREAHLLSGPVIEEAVS